MGNKYRYLAHVYAIVAMMLFFLSTSCSNDNQLANLPKTQAPLSEPQFAIGAPGSVFVNPKSQAAAPGSEINLRIEVMPAAWGISAAEIQISFDPKNLEAANIQTGDALGLNPIVGAQKIDNELGTITYALARVGKTTAPGVQGVLATIVFKVKTSATAATKVELTEVGLADENFDEIKGIEYQGASIVVSSSSPP